MGALVIVCRETGRIVDIGIETDAFSFSSTPAFASTVHCPHCGSAHRFSKEDLLLCETIDGAVHYQRAA